MNLYGLNKKLENARQRGFLLNQINKLRIKIHGNLCYIIICCYVKIPIPIMHTHFFRIISQNL